MMQTSVSCRPRADLVQHEGFSLLEMLVVLALISIMAALAAPRLAEMVQSIGSSGDRAEVLRQLEDLPLRARLQNGAIRLPSGAAMGALLQLPDGWSVSTITALHVRDNGVCDPATVRVRGAGTEEKWELAMPDCRVRNAL
ncbi:prepilin-type N-terminal cleavage/methylation domain-containing protein [Thermomonas sp.]|uniref:prepilin-type N-terminal cleavage/methylation domain-containing protein n=1 Tax=Thermomonas sp. TaxID=1971895 RepID=UPI00391CEE19